MTHNITYEAVRCVGMILSDVESYCCLRNKTTSVNVLHVLAFSPTEVTVLLLEPPEILSIEVSQLGPPSSPQAPPISAS